jgi:succinate dehydrogenase / fumarate reductase, membrane anchor subunit
VTSYATDKRRVEGAGSAHHGAGTWIKERVSSLILIPLTGWGFWAASALSGSGFDGLTRWLQSPVNAALLGVLILVSLYHMRLGLRVVIEDYVHKPFGRGGLLFLNTLFCLALAVIAIVSIVKVALHGGAGA